MNEPLPVTSWLDAAPLIDLLLGVIVVAGLWGGWRRGLLVASADLLALGAGLVFAFWAYPQGVALLEAQGLRWGVWTAPLAFLAAFVLARIALGLLLGRLVAAVPGRAHASKVNRALGVIPGAGSGLVNALVAAMLLLALPLDDAFSRKVAESVIVARLSEPAEWLEARLGPIFNPAFERTLSRLTVRPDSRESLSLPFKVAAVPERPDLEGRMLELVNAERTRQACVRCRPTPRRGRWHAHMQGICSRAGTSRTSRPTARTRSTGCAAPACAISLPARTWPWPATCRWRTRA